jgi:hypothetical protein
MVTPETDGFKEFGELRTASHPGTLGRKSRPSLGKSMTADERKVARNRWQNR